MVIKVSKNVEYSHVQEISGWRKVAIGTWKTCGDPSVYGVMDVPAEQMLKYLEELKQKTGKRVTITHFVGRTIAEVIKRHSDINCVLRLGALYQRKNVDVFFQVATDSQGEDLSGMTIRNADQKSIEQISEEMNERVQLIRAKKDPSFTKMKSVMKFLPGILAYPMLWATGFFLYSLNLWTSLLGSPRDPFGSVMVTNIGSIGLDMAFAPLVPYSRIPILIVVGEVREQPVVREGQVVVGKILRLCATFDHRVIDGMHASHMCETIRKVFENPQQELKASKT